MPIPRFYFRFRGTADMADLLLASSRLRMTQTGASKSVATLDRVPRVEDHVALGELGRIDEAF
jgi:hypothetical protein